MRPRFRTLYERDVARGLALAEAPARVVDQDLNGLPILLQTYLRRVGVVGAPRVRTFRARFSGQMRRHPKAGWMRIEADQHTFLGAEPARLFLMKASAFGIPFQAYHRFAGPTATMQVRVASLFQVVDARGPEMDRSETVTFFNDLCLLAPAALLEVDVHWEEGPGRTLRGAFRHQGQSVAATLHFDAQGDLVDFVSEDRLQSADGRAYASHPWSTPVSEYGDASGFHLMSRAGAVWAESTGPFPYARFHLEELVYNVGSGASGGTLP